VERRLLCHLEVISVEKTLRSGTLLTLSEEKPMIRFHSFIQEEERSRSGKTVKCGKNTVLISPNSDELKERADTWHPDPEQDRKLGGPGANQRAREDRESSPKEDPKDPKKLNPGESYMDFAKRHGYKSSPKKEGIVGKLKRKMGLNNSYDYEGEVLESTVPGKPAERVGALSNIDIPVDEREAAKQRTLAKAAALRKKREEQKEEFEIEEGMTMKDFKANRQKNKRRSASADAEKRGHVGKEWYNSGRKYSPDEAKSSRANMDDEERRTRHRSAVDPDNEDDNNYSADKTKNPKKQRKQSAMGEMVSFSDFMEARAEDKRGLEPTGANRKKQKTGVKLPGGGVAHPATSYSGGQNPHLRGKGGGSKEQRRAASRRYVDQPGGVYAKPENKQGEGRYAAKQARKRPDLGSRFD
jgi:hypothetical protein